MPNARNKNIIITDCFTCILAGSAFEYNVILYILYAILYM
jgi:hypothetical protein